MQPPIRIVAASDASLLVTFADEISREANEAVIALFRAIRQARPKWLRNLHPAYTSLLIDFDLATADHARVEALVREQKLEEVTLEPGKTVEVPVRYGGEWGPDLREVAAMHEMTPQQVIERHASVSYRVAFLGFVPGFAYLIGLPEEIHTPRLPLPRTTVPIGSVGIAGAQTGVYPASTPGGWRLIGRTEKLLAPDWVEPGDEVRFVPEIPA
ncbi:MAG: 5-oxoprolinase subunit PxpB [Bryobacteraceae bacterium]|nr:5-oxoprolinase subunit PxpB [Bryobacteraceae bacterium]